MRRYRALGIPDSMDSPQGDSGPPGPVDEVRRSIGPRFKTLPRVDTRSKIPRTAYPWQKNKGKHRGTEITE